MMIKHDTERTATFVKFLSVSTLPLVWGLLSANPLTAQANDDPEPTPVTSTTTATQNQTNIATLKSSEASTASSVSDASSTPDTASTPTEPTSPTTASSTTALSSTSASDASKIQASDTPPNQPEVSSAETAPASANQVSTNSVTPTTAAVTSATTKRAATSTGTITNPVKATPTSTPSEQALAQLRDKITAAVNTFNTGHGTAFNVTDLIYQNGRLSVPLTTGNSIDDATAYQQLLQLQTSVITENRRYYLTTLGGNGLSLYFSVNTDTHPVTEGVTLAIPVIVEAVTDDGQLLQSTELKATNGKQLLYNGTWSSVAPTVAGYQLTSTQPVNATGIWNTTFDYTQLSDQNQLVIRYVYQPNQETATITYIDDELGKTLATITTTGTYGTTQPVDLEKLIATYTANGYTLVSSDLPATGIDYNQAGVSQRFTVHLKSATKADVPPTTVIAPTIAESLNTPTPIPDDRVSLAVPLVPSAISTLFTPTSEPAEPEAKLTVEDDRGIQVMPIPELTQAITQFYPIGAFTLTGHVPLSKVTTAPPTETAVSSKATVNTHTTSAATTEPLSLWLAASTQSDTTDLSTAKRHDRLPQGNPVWAILNHPDFIKEPGGATHHSQFGQYLSSISGTVNFGASATELQTKNFMNTSVQG